MLKDMLEERRQRPRQTQSDFFDYVLKEVERKDTMLTEDIALDLMFVMLFASYETTSVALTLAIKYLSEHPSFLQQLTVTTNFFLISSTCYILCPYKCIGTSRCRKNTRQS